MIGIIYSIFPFFKIQNVGFLEKAILMLLLLTMKMKLLYLSKYHISYTIKFQASQLPSETF